MWYPCQVSLPRDQHICILQLSHRVTQSINWPFRALIIHWSTFSCISNQIVLKVASKLFPISFNFHHLKLMPFPQDWRSLFIDDVSLNGSYNQNHKSSVEDRLDVVSVVSGEANDAAEEVTNEDIDKISVSIFFWFALILLVCLFGVWGRNEWKAIDHSEFENYLLRMYCTLFWRLGLYWIYCIPWGNSTVCTVLLYYPYCWKMFYYNPHCLVEQRANY